MASKARVQFEKNRKDVDNLLLFHRETGGEEPGRRDKRLEVLNKSAIVLITAVWEAYCEDLAAEALEHIVRSTKDSSSLSKHVRKLVAEELKEDKHELAVWQLSGDGWKKCLQDRHERMRNARNWDLNTPKAKPIDELFEQTIGLQGVSKAWYWPGMSAERACKKLDNYVTLRGAIAHRGAAPSSCRKTDVTGYLNHVRRIVEKTDARVHNFAKTTSGKEPRVRLLP